MKFNTKLSMKMLASVACVSMLLGCSGADEEQDAALEPVNTSATLTGLTMNGYLANALVWVDIRENDTVDGFEPFAYTDNDGYFSYNPITGTDYCASDDDTLLTYCLQTGVTTGSATIKAAGGIELLTGEAFRAVLTTDVDLATAQSNYEALLALGAQPEGDTSTWQTQLDGIQTKLSPLTSIDHYLPSSTDIVSVLETLGYEIPSEMSAEDVLKVDYIAGLSQNNEVADDLFSAAVTLSRLVDVLTTNIEEATDTIDFAEEGLPLSSADTVYAALAESLAGQGTSSLTSFKTKNASLDNIGSNNFPNSVLIIAAVDKMQDLLAAFSSVQDELEQIAENDNISVQMEHISDIGVNYFNENQGDDDTATDWLGFNQVIILPTLSDPIVFDSSSDADALNTLTEFLSDPTNRVVELLINVQEEANDEQTEETVLSTNVDLLELVDELLEIAEQPTGADDLADEDVEIEVSELAEVETQDGSSFWVHQRLSLSGTQDNNEQGQVIAYFDGEDNAESGALVMCVAYQNDSDPSENISAQRFEGTWAVIGGSSQNRLSVVAEGFTVQMKVLGETLGADIDADQQIDSIPRLANEMYGKFGFTLNEDSATWHSDDASISQSYGLLFDVDVPANDSECASTLSLVVP